MRQNPNSSANLRHSVSDNAEVIIQEVIFKHYMYYPCHYHGVCKLNICLNAEHMMEVLHVAQGDLKTKVYHFIIKNKRMRLIKV